ncbi:MAG: ATP-binding protein [Legionellaceae bacterium]|nr:ATP-binding protein [Legionellaceae bacterium]
MKKFLRFAEKKIYQSLKAFPVTYIAGPRQSGKTTLAQGIASGSHPLHYLTFDDLQLQSSAQRDPDAFLNSFNKPVVLDEIQMVPELFRPLKIKVDENRALDQGGRGQFLLTGSASVLALPKLSDALVGRMAIHTLLPFSATEISHNKPYNFIDHAFQNNWEFEQLSHHNLLEMMISASYPELLTLDTYALRNMWCNGYMNTILQRDVRALAEIEKINALPDLLRLIAARTGGLLNEAGLSRDANLNHITLKKYRTLLESLFLTLSIPAWSKNLGKRLIKAPKLYVHDINILLYLLNTELAHLSTSNTTLFDQVLETFVAIELTKQLTFSETAANLYHFRTAAGQEIDFILEGPNQKTIAIEVKAKSKVSLRDFQHIETLQLEIGDAFHQGFVVYQGNDVLSFGKNIWAIPFAKLWS